VSTASLHGARVLVCTHNELAHVTVIGLHVHIVRAACSYMPVYDVAYVYCSDAAAGTGASTHTHARTRTPGL